MFQILVLLFIFIPLIEIALLIQVGQVVGLGSTLLLIVFTGILGAWLARSQGFMLLNRLNRELASGQMPSETMFEGLMILCGGLVLLTPGLVTDALGFFLLLPWGRRIIIRWIQSKLEQQFKQGRTINIKYFKGES